ncbi:hypothetical protein C8R44DRAFT_232354 [Mycena epipterygia]|nr:hypothetical protein C8R44DRAFT_232354 [Mycena epipterygia]
MPVLSASLPSLRATSHSTPLTRHPAHRHLAPRPTPRSYSTLLPTLGLPPSLRRALRHLHPTFLRVISASRTPHRRRRPTQPATPSPPFDHASRSGYDGGTRAELPLYLSAPSSFPSTSALHLRRPAIPIAAPPLPVLHSVHHHNATSPPRAPALVPRSAPHRSALARSQLYLG